MYLASRIELPEEHAKAVLDDARGYASPSLAMVLTA